MPTDTLHLPTELPFARVCASARVQPYRFIHKGLRVLLTQTQQEVGQMDVRDPLQRAALVAVMEQTLSVCCDHLAHENRFFHEPLGERAPRSVAAFYGDHLEHLQAIGALRLLLQRVRDAGEHGAALAYEAYLRFSVFVGENLTHMAEEETVLTQALWDHFSDDELNALSDRLRACLAPHEQAFYLQWMARGLNNAELAALLGEAQQQAPAPAFRGLLDLALAELPEHRRAALCRALGVPAVEGLAQ